MRGSTQHARSVRQQALACCVGLTVASLAYGQVNLSLEPADTSASPGAMVELELWARSTSPLLLDGAEVVLNWDPAQLMLTGHSPETSTYTWGASGFPSSSPMNTTWDDGEALYQCLARLGAAPPQTDIMLVILQFTASSNATVAAVNIPSTGDTLVASAGINVLERTSGAVIRIGSPDAGTGGGNTGGGSGGGDSGTGGGGDNTGNGGDTGSGDVPGNQGGDVGGDDSGNGPPPAGGSQGDGNDETSPARPVRALPCGAGAVEGVVLSVLLMTVGPRRKK